MNRSLVVAAFLLAAPACSRSEPQPSSSSQAPRSASRIDAADAIARVAKGAVLVDVREPDELEDGRVDGAVSMPLSKIKSGDAAYKSWLAALPKGTPVVAYCAVGARAQKAADTFAASGVEAYNGGGYGDLVKAGAKVAKGKP